jgi:bifunctional pyridoxal-dependent enzyme with beta-cystathionase and maltose regulon repressor activities
MCCWVGPLPWQRIDQAIMVESKCSYCWKKTRDFVTDFLKFRNSQIKIKPPEATFLAWLDWQRIGAVAITV